MKYLIYLMLLLSLFACSSKQDMATVSGTVELNGSMTPDSILVGLYKMESQKFGELVDFTTTTNNAFTLHAKPGTYTLAAWAFGYENAKLNIFLPDVKSAAKASITLAQTALPEQIDKVSLVGDFNEWNWHEAVPMRKEAGLWKLDDTSVLDKEKSYKFIVNKETFFYYDLQNTNFRTQRDKASFESLYEGGEIVFDPSLYAAEQNPSSIEIDGPFSDFAAMADSIALFNRTFRTARRAIRSLSTEDIVKSYALLQERLTNLDNHFNGNYRNSYITSLRLQTLINASPVTKEVLTLLEADEPDKNKLAAFFTGDDYASFQKDVESMLGELDVNSALLDGDFVSAVTSIDTYAKEALKSDPELQVSPDYFSTKLLAMEEKGTNDEISAAVLFNIGWEAAYEGNAEVAEPILLKLKANHPSHWSVEKGTVENSLIALKMTSGVEAPAFAVQTLKGDSLKLDDLRGKFVFIDFWGSWCGPCRREIPHIKEAYAHFSQDKVQIMGLARDNLKPLTDYIAKEKILYPNAIAPADLLKAYGISAYPTTYLIAPDGRIVTKNLRGGDLIEEIEKQLGAWEMKQQMQNKG